jgi:hypothetical protein
MRWTMGMIRSNGFACACVLCTIFGWYFIAELLMFQTYDHLYGEEWAMAHLQGGLIGLSMPFVLRLFKWWVRFTDYRRHRR